MKAFQAEILLAVLCITSTILSTIALVSFTIAWQHWARTLNVCISVNCGCILYGITAFSTFMGGDVKLCHFGVYGLIPALIIGLCFGVYHGYRRCVDRSLDQPRAVNFDDNRNNFDGQVVVVGPKRRAPFKQWIPAAFCAALISCLSISHAIVMTDGYYKTCEQYRKNLIHYLGSRGREAQVIRHRLTCGAIFDYMDYLQPDANNWVRGEEINTGFALQLTIICAWLNFFVWVIACVVNSVMAQKRRSHNLMDRFCCCCC